MKKLFVGASWKMNKDVDESLGYFAVLKNYIHEKADLLTKRNIEVFILPTFLPLYPISLMLKGSALKYGAQDSFWADDGAYTGEVSPMHLKKIGCSFVELAHPERINILKEDRVLINKKLKGVLKNGLTPILCIGEEKEYKNKKEVYDFLTVQIRQYYYGLGSGEVKNILLAYEPVWAIGSDKSAPLDYISDSLGFIRDFLSKEYGENAGEQQYIIYGGSVSQKSAFDILKLSNNNGIFIGRASLNYDYFIDMINMAIDASTI